MEIALLTSSRADFGFFIPLLKEAQKYPSLRFHIIAFGTHLSVKHGSTVKEIEKLGFNVSKKIKTVLNGDSPQKITETIGLVHHKFSKIWSSEKYDLILCLGDRYEMYAAVSASVPFNIPVAHLSGGEETTGAIDNYYRHALTLMSKYHFTNTLNNAERVKQLLGHSKNVFYTGSLAIDNINSTKLYSIAEFKKHFNFDVSLPYILFTFHPETANHKKNVEYAVILKKVLETLSLPVLITMPNADTFGSIIRENLQAAAKNNPNIFLVESLGSKGYYTAMKHCSFVMGNSSSGIVEAASFSKYVINIGDRQKGREKGKNVIDVDINQKKIIAATKKIASLPNLKKKNIYGDGNAANRILRVLNKLKDNL